MNWKLLSPPPLSFDPDSPQNLERALGWLGKILSYRFQYSAKDDNSEFSLPSMVPYAKVKVQVIVFGYRTKIDIWELGIVTSKQFHVS